MPDTYYNNYNCQPHTMPYSSVSPNNKPYLKIQNQPIERFRFRYETEQSTSHGTLTSNNGDKKKKEFPSVQIKNYHGCVKVTARLVTKNHTQHYHRLVGPNCKDGVCVLQVDPSNNMLAIFQNMGIEYTAQKNVKVMLREKLLKQHNIDPASASPDEVKKLEMQVKKENDNLEMNIVCIRFDAQAMDGNIHFDEVYSNEIRNLKSTSSGVLKICQMSKFTSSCKGKEDVILLCEKVKRDDIQVQFFEIQNNQVVWSANGIFQPKDVHHQFAIVFKTPPYKITELSKAVEVYIQLKRPSNGDTSEPIDFVYTPANADSYSNVNRKRQRVDQSSSSSFSPSVMGGYSNSSSMSPGATSSSLTSHENSVNIMDFKNSSTYENLSSAINPLLSQPLSPGSDIIGTPSPQSLSGEANPPFDLLSYMESSEISLFDMPLDHIQADSVPIDNANEAKTTKKPMNDELQRYSCLTKFAKSGNVCDLLKYFDFRIGIEDANGENAIFHAIRNGNYQLAMYMLWEAKSLRAWKIIKNSKNRSQQTIFHLVVIADYVPLVQLLLKLDWDASSQDKNGNNVLHLACKSSSSECLQKLLQNIQHNKHIINCRNSEGFTPLHLSVINDQVDHCKLLIQFNADVNCTAGKCGRSPLHLCVENHTSILDLLLGCESINVNNQTFSGDTPLHVAIYHKADKSVIIRLLQNSADPNIRTFRSSNEDDEEDELQQHPSVLDLIQSDDQMRNLFENYPRQNSSKDLPNVFSKMKLDNCTMSHEDEGYASKELQFILDDVTIVKLCHMLDPPTNKWETLSTVLGIPVSPDKLENNASPTRTILQEFFNQKYGVTELAVALEASKLFEAKKIVDEVVHCKT